MTVSLSMLLNFNYGGFAMFKKHLIPRKYTELSISIYQANRTPELFHFAKNFFLFNLFFLPKAISNCFAATRAVEK